MPKKKKKRIVLLDSHAILHRAYHALPDFASSKGKPTGALYGLGAMLISIIKQLKPDYIFATFDLPKPTYRHEVYADYKAGRKQTDDDLISQIKQAYGFYKAFNIPIYEMEGYEADDVLGTLAVKLKKDFDVFIASGDMDTLQLVDEDKVCVYTLKRGINDTIVYNEDAVKERFGFDPVLLQDYKGLRGDPSDNIIGVPGVGEKTATTLIQNFGSLENIYKTLEKKPEEFEKAGITPRIQRLLIENKEEAEFSKMLATIQCDVPVEPKIPEKVWKEGVSSDKIQKLFRELEFRALSVRVKDILGKPVDKENGENMAQPEGAVEENVSPEVLEEAKVALWLLNSSITSPDTEDILNYTGEKTTENSYKKLLSELKEKKLLPLFKEIEKPLIPIIRNMEESGVKVDVEFLKDLSEEYHKDLDKLEKDIWKMAGEEFNVNSSQQLSHILFEKLELRYKGMRKTSTGKFSTREDILQKLKETHPIIEKILEYREFQKLLSTYIDAIPKNIASDGRLHANFLQTGTTTGRMSSNNPNLQNIPISTERGRRIRKAFVSKKDFSLIAFDYSQIELRIAAILSEDNKLIEVFKSGKDIHAAVAARVFNVSEDKVTKEMRRQAKVINFGILYGMGVNSLKDGLGSDRKTAQEFYNQYFTIYDELGAYLDKVKADAKKNGYTETLYNRRRYFEGFNSSLPFIRAQAERMAINAPIQGTSSDLIKKAMVQIDGYLRKEKLQEDVRLILQIHDEVIYEVNDKVMDEVAPKIEKIMEEVLDMKQSKGVPIKADYAKGKNWEQL